MPKKDHQKKRQMIIISVYVRPDDKRRFDDIVRLARMSNPNISKGEVVRKMISDLHSNLLRLGWLPLPAEPEIFDRTSTVRRNGNGDQPVEK